MDTEEYRFSPILNKKRFSETLEYIAREVIEMGDIVLKRKMPLDTLTIFAHFDNEHKFLAENLHEYGPESSYSHGLTSYVEPKNFKVLDQSIRYLGVRAPDPRRPQVGYGDFPVKDLQAARDLYFPSDFILEKESGLGQPMLEISHPDFDVLAYIVKH